MPYCGRDLDCTSRADVHATTDIAGRGVIASFLVSALLTIFAVVFGYLSDSLPEWYLNDTDAIVISTVQSCALTRFLKTHVWAPWCRLHAWVLLPFGGKPNTAGKKLSRYERQEAVTRFILQLSDQQLATGLAILIAALSNQCALSVYEFQVAFALAWFSSTCHLVTLDCLKDYFIKHAVVRNWRVFGMLVLLLLLVYTLILTMASIDETLPVACTYIYFGDKSVVNSESIGLYVIACAVLTVVILLWNYIIRIYWSYKRTDGKATFLERSMFQITTRGMRKKYQPSMAEAEYMISEAVLEHRSEQRRRKLDIIRKSNGILHRLHIFDRASKMYGESFLSLGPTVTFMISYGFSQLYVDRWDHPDIPVHIEKSLGFGQITPIFLLVLPLFAAAEIYYEVKDLPVSESLKGEAKRPQSCGETSTFPLLANESLSPTTTSIDVEMVDFQGLDDRFLQTMSALQRLFYRPVKSIAYDTEIAKNAEELQAISRRKAALLKELQSLQLIESSLSPTTPLALAEFVVMSGVALALGMLLNVQSRDTIVATFILFGLWIVYSLSGIMSDVKDSWQKISEEDYQRLLKAARSHKDLDQEDSTAEADA